MPYSPNDSHITPETLAFLHSPEGRLLFDQVAALLTKHLALGTKDLSVAEIEKLRKSFPKDAVHACLAIAQLQPKARQKFPDLAHKAGFIYALPEALEQATDSAVAAHKAVRFAQVNPAHIYDFCCGIGGDALALAHIARTTAIDISASRLICLRYNFESAPTKFSLQTQQADIIAPSFFSSLFPLHSSALFHIDPARRSAGKRSPRYEDLIPGPDFLKKLIANFSGGAIKLSSAVDFDTLPPGHLEIISHNQSVVQAVLYVGTLASLFPENTRTATIFKNHRLTVTYTATPASPLPSPLSIQHSAFSILYESDPSLTRSQLAATLAASFHLTPLTPDAGYLLGGAPPLAHPAFTPFQLLQILPYSESKLLAALQNSGLPPTAPGPIEVKTRGKIPGLDTDRLQLLLSQSTHGEGHQRAVFIFRQGGQTSQTLAAIAQRLP